MIVEIFEITEDQIDMLEEVTNGPESFCWATPNKSLDKELYALVVKKNRDLDALVNMGFLEQRFDDEAITTMDKWKIAVREQMGANVDRDFRMFRITDFAWKFFQPVSKYVN